MFTRNTPRRTRNIYTCVFVIVAQAIRTRFIIRLLGFRNATSLVLKFEKCVSAIIAILTFRAFFSTPVELYSDISPAIETSNSDNRQPKSNLGRTHCEPTVEIVEIDFARTLSFEYWEEELTKYFGRTLEFECDLRVKFGRLMLSRCPSVTVPPSW